jgi:hypothetical protein
MLVFYYCFNPLFDPKFLQENTEFVIGFLCASVGAILLCAWVAPKAKKTVGVVAALLTLYPWITTSPLCIDYGLKGPPLFEWPMNAAVKGVTIGAGLALFCLFWILSRRSDQTKPLGCCRQQGIEFDRVGKQTRSHNGDAPGGRQSFANAIT